MVRAILVGKNPRRINHLVQTKELAAMGSKLPGTGVRPNRPSLHLQEHVHDFAKLAKGRLALQKLSMIRCFHIQPVPQKPEEAKKFRATAFQFVRMVCHDTAVIKYSVKISRCPSASGGETPRIVNQKCMDAAPAILSDMLTSVMIQAWA